MLRLVLSFQMKMDCLKMKVTQYSSYLVLSITSTFLRRLW